MTTFNEKLTARWKDAANAVLGLWLIASPWALQYATQQTAAWNAWIAGAVIAVAALAAVFAFQKWEEWVNAALGAWLVAAPFVLGFAAQTAVAWNQIVVGAVVAALALWTAMTTGEDGITSKA
jgi:hypothetical protein